ncbi:MAG: ABC transporter permease [Acidobacteria bacterium]|nr:MAG: ABC transporter permease [Acidobacteriota bacterium]
MKPEISLAIKYCSLNRASFARFTALAAILSISAAVAIMIVSQAVSNGFSRQIHERILSNEAHISIFLKNGEKISDLGFIQEKIQKYTEIKSIQSLIYEHAIVFGQNSSSYCIIKVVPDAERKVLIGEELAKKLQLKPNDLAEILVLSNSETKKLSLRIDGTIRTGLYDYDATLFQIPSDLFLSVTKEVTLTPNVVKLTLWDAYSSDKIAREIKKNLGEEYKVIDWQEANQPLFAALSLEKKITLAIVSFIFLLSCVNITTTLALVVSERKKDIAILRTCGVRAKNLFLIFLVQGMLISSIGIILGIILSFLLCGFVNNTELLQLSSQVYSISEIYLQPGFFEVSLTFVITIILSLVASIYPAISASKLKPIEIFRND